MVLDVLNIERSMRQYYPFSITEVHYSGAGGVMDWASVTLDGRIDLHVFQVGIFIALRCSTEISESYVRLRRSVVRPQFIFMDDNAFPQMAEMVEEYLCGILLKPQ